MLQTVTTAPPAPAVALSGEPSERMMFQLTDLSDNHNKFYLVELWPAANNMVRFRASWGRVGTRPQVKEIITTRQDVSARIAEKTRKGYRPVDLHTPEVEIVDENGITSAPKIDPRIGRLVDWIYMEAGENIQSYLAVPVEALSQSQIDAGRALLSKAQGQNLWLKLNPFNRGPRADELAATVQAYYNAIPTKLPARIDSAEVVRRFCNEFSEQEDRLNQLEAAIATMKARRQQPGMSAYDALGAQLTPLEPDDSNYIAMLEYVRRTQVHGYNVKVSGIYEVLIPAERRAYEQNGRGVAQRQLLFHGTRNGNVRHILRTGLICPRSAAHGRMLGNGIYLANKSSKSINYCSSSRHQIPQMLFVVEAALGNMYVAPQADQFNAPPQGYDSVWGKAGHTGLGGPAKLQNDEFVVFSPAQQTIRYLITFER